MAVKPLNRLQAFLAKIAGEPGPDVTPRNVTEYYLDKIAGSGGGGGGVMFVHFTGTASEAITDKTYDEIATAVENGQLVVFVDDISFISYGSGIASKVVFPDESVAFSTVIPIPTQNGLTYLQLGYGQVEGASYFLNNN